MTGSRYQGDSWDLASGVGATATMVAAARALAGMEPDALVVDPFAAPLVRAVGMDFFTRLVDGHILCADDGPDSPDSETAATARLIVDVMAVRTRFFDDFFADSGAAGVRQAVILASGLDSRAYRLGWPAGTVVYEIDQPRVIEFKSAAMAAAGATPTALRRAVAVDLRDDWAGALVSAGFDARQPTAWSAEGLLIYLPPDAQDSLFDTMTELSAPGSRLATEHHRDAGAALGERARALGRSWRAHGFDLELGDLFYPGERNSPADYLVTHGWRVAARDRAAVFAGYGRRFPDIDAAAALRDSLSITATRK